jgi:hypothetical protein
MAIISQVKNKEQLLKLKTRQNYSLKALKIGFIIQTILIAYLLTNHH